MPVAAGETRMRALVLRDLTVGTLSLVFLLGTAAGATAQQGGTAQEREEWPLSADGITHLRLRIRPDKGDRPCRATLTTIALS